MHMSTELLEKSNVQEKPEYGSGPADPQKVREAWLDFVRPAADIGKLEKFRTIKAKTPQQKDVAKKQNYYLTRKSFGSFGPNYDLIRWE